MEKQLYALERQEKEEEEAIRREVALVQECSGIYEKRDLLLCHIPGLAIKRLKPCFCFPQLLKCLLIRFGLLDSFFKLHHFLIQLFQPSGRFFFFPAAVLFQRLQPVHKLFIGMSFPLSLIHI